jgi:hypothetical protein
MLKLKPPSRANLTTTKCSTLIGVLSAASCGRMRLPERHIGFGRSQRANWSSNLVGDNTEGAERAKRTLFSQAFENIRERGDLALLLRKYFATAT